MTTARGQWADLPVRVLSALVIVLVAGAAIWLGGAVFAGFVCLLCALMVWELVRMIAPGQMALAVGCAATAPLVLFVGHISPFDGIGAGLALSGLFYLRNRAYAFVFVVYSASIIAASWGLIALRQGPELGVFWVVWVIAIVVTTDVAGYFAGRLLGGPKLWPRISPKKTWSGTIAGWGGAVCVGCGLMILGTGQMSYMVLLLSFALSLASQIGDIAESAIKRSVGVKDSSNLIPGHGGFLDRLDGVLGAALLVFLVQTLFGVRLEALL